MVTKKVLHYFTKLIDIAHASHMEVVLDVNPDCMQKIGASYDNLKPFHDIGADILRMDICYGRERDTVLVNNPYGIRIEFNASIMPADYLNNLIVSGGDRKLMRLDREKLSLYADLNKYAMDLNNMVTDRHGNAYVGAYGFDITTFHGQGAKGWIIHVHPDGQITGEGDEAGMIGPNGMVITSDGRQMIAADTIRSQLIQFSLDEYGCMHNPCIYANTESGPDGISLSAEGTIWAAFPHQRIAAEIEKKVKYGRRCRYKIRHYAARQGITDNCLLSVYRRTVS